MQIKRLIVIAVMLLCFQAVQAYSFIVMGDLNGGGCERNDRVARVVEKIDAEAGIDFFISTGDLIDGYPENNGNISSCFATDPFDVNGSTCPQGIPNGNVKAMLSPLMDRVPKAGLDFAFYPVIGNHDDNWGSNWYPSPCGDGICEFLHQDGINDDAMIAQYIDDHPPGNVCSLNPNDSDHSRTFYYAFEYQNSYFIVLKQNDDNYGMLSCNGLPGSHPSCADYCADPALFDDPARNDKCYSVEQFDWLRAKLEQANNQGFEHIFVFAHAPLVTSGDGHGPTNGAEQLKDLMDQYKVDIYFNGHNHAYERTHKIKADQLNDQGTAYITVGVVGALTNGNDTDWFTAASYHDWTSYGTSGFDEHMTTYLKITVDENNISGTVKSLGITDPTDVVDSFVYGSEPQADLIFQNSFEAPIVATIAGCQILPADNMWNTAIDAFPLHPNNSNYLTEMGPATTLHADFGTTWQNIDIGIPYTVVPNNQALEPLELLWWDESDLGEASCHDGTAQNMACYPIPANPNVEGGSDQHILLLQQDSCILYEVFDAQLDGGNQWTGGSGAIWDLSQNQQRPLDWTSADASGLAILPGLIRYDEVMIEQEIKHAIRFTMSSVQSGYIRPASHSDGQGGNDPNKPPMGLRLRLKSDFDIASFDPSIQVILTAMKKYGIVLADTGSDMFISGEHHDDWDDSLLSHLSNVSINDFEVVYSGDVIPYPSQ